MVHINFRGNSYEPMAPLPLFSLKFVWTNGPKSSPKVSPETGIGPWIALPRPVQNLQNNPRYPDGLAWVGALLHLRCLEPDSTSHNSSQAQRKGERVSVHCGTLGLKGLLTFAPRFSKLATKSALWPTNLSKYIHPKRKLWLHIWNSSQNYLQLTA